jgi:hypothetical protein
MRGAGFSRLRGCFLASTLKPEPDNAGGGTIRAEKAFQLSRFRPAAGKLYFLAIMAGGQL